MSLLSFEEARARLLAGAQAVREKEKLDLALAHGRVLAEDLVSPLTVPPFSNAAMDGYALREEDLAASRVLPVKGRFAAGDTPGQLEPGCAARIFTGAPLPEGADTVVMQEVCTAEGEAVRIDIDPPQGQHVRLAGSDIQAGQVILKAGSRLSAAALGLAASVGIRQVHVYRCLKAAIFFTGSELAEPGQALAPGQIYNSNRYIMRGILAGLGVEILDLGIIRDEREATRNALRRAAAEADVILTSGGMSEGEEDHVTAAVKAEGRIDVWKIAAKPGKPLAFGTVGKAAFVGLPGNPVAVWVGLAALVQPFLRLCQGMVLNDTAMLTQPMRADFQHKVKGNRLEFVRVRRNAQGGLDLYPNQDSSIISSAVWADGLALLPAGSQIQPGDVVAYLPGPE